MTICCKVNKEKIQPENIRLISNKILSFKLTLQPTVRILHEDWNGAITQQERREFRRPFGGDR